MDKCKKCNTDLVDGVCPKCSLERAHELANAEREKTKKTIGEILAMGKQYSQAELAAQFVSEGRSAGEFKDEILKLVSAGKVVFNAPGKETQTTQTGFRSLGEQLIAVARAEAKSNPTVDKRLIFERTAPSGMSEGVPSDGGFAVQSDFTTALLTLMHETGVLYPKCRRIPIGAGANGISAPIIDESSRATGSRFGGVQIYRDPEGQEATAKKIKLALLEMKLKKLHGLCYVTDEMLQDAVQLEAIIKGAFSEEFGFVIDDEIIRGDGASQMLGILNANCLVSVAIETGQTADTIVAENLEKMYARMPARSKSNAVWYINDECWPQLFQLHHVAGTSAVPIFVPPGGISVAPFGILLGRPIQPLEQASALGDVGDVIFADLNEYLVIDKGVLDAQASIHVRFIYDEMTYKFTLRNNGQPIWKSALTPYKGTASTKSPFITLAARA